MGIEREPNEEAEKSWRVEQTIGLIKEVIAGWEKPGHNEQDLRRIEAEVGLNLATLKKEGLTDEKKTEVLELLGPLRGVADDERLVEITNQLEQRLTQEN